MHRSLSILALAATCLVHPAHMLSQSAPPGARSDQSLVDVVYFKEGGMVRGTMVDPRSGESILIRTSDGKLYRYSMSQIDRMMKEPAPKLVLPQHKIPVLAAGLSYVLPGAGQAYNGQWGKGGVLLGGFGLGVLLYIGDAFNQLFDYIGSGDNRRSSAYYAGEVLMYGTYCVSIIDAVATSLSINRRIRAAGALTVEPRLVPLSVFPAPILSTSASRVAPTSSGRVGLSIATIRF